MGPNYVLDKGFVVDSAATNVVAGRFCKLGTSNTLVTTASVAGELVLGVYMETLDTAKVTTGKATIDVRILGIARVVCSAAIARFARVSTDATGRAVTTSAVAGTNQAQAGLALTPTSVAGDV